MRIKSRSKVRKQGIIELQPLFRGSRFCQMDCADVIRNGVTAQPNNCIYQCSSSLEGRRICHVYYYIVMLTVQSITLFFVYCSLSLSPLSLEQAINKYSDTSDSYSVFYKLYRRSKAPSLLLVIITVDTVIWCNSYSPTML